MLAVNDFRTYITAIKTAIAEITASETVIDDSQINKFVEYLDDDVILILGIIPKHNFVGKPENLKSKDITSILVLQKVTRSEQLHSDFLDTIGGLQTVTQKVIDKLMDDYEDENNCNFMRKLILPSFDINPIWGLSSCDGYQIDFSLNTNV
jgi:hypothetical protein